MTVLTPRSASPSSRRRTAAAALLAAAALASIGSTVEAADTPAAAAASAPTSRQLAALCADCAIVAGTVVEKRKGKATALGTAGGAVVGGVVGHKAGDGSAVATGVGAVAGGLIGREIEKRAKRHDVWVTTVTTRDGKARKFEAAADPGWKPGEVVRIENGVLVKGS